MAEGNEPPLDWDALVPHIVNPTKVALIEALRYMNQPLSANEITRLFDDPQLTLSRISYHLVTLAEEGVLMMLGPSSKTEKSFFLPRRDLVKPHSQAA
jgi:hypothetical protein